jgi:Helix-turn-helix domain
MRRIPALLILKTMKRRQTITQTALNDMLKGETVTAMKYARKMNTTRLGARIYDLRKLGFPIASLMMTDKYGERYAEYFIYTRDIPMSKELAVKLEMI